MTQPVDRRFRRLTLAIMVLLVLEFLVGMWVNLFVTISSHHPGAATRYGMGAAAGIGWALTAGPRALGLHVALGLVLGACALLHTATVRGRPAVGSLLWSLVGLGGVLGAASSGAAFLDDGAPLHSLLMSLGFAVALVGYGMAMTPGRPRDAPPPS